MKILFVCIALMISSLPLIAQAKTCLHGNSAAYKEATDNPILSEEGALISWQTGPVFYNFQIEARKAVSKIYINYKIGGPDFTTNVKISFFDGHELVSSLPFAGENNTDFDLDTSGNWHSFENSISPLQRRAGESLSVGLEFGLGSVDDTRDITVSKVCVEFGFSREDIIGPNIEISEEQEQFLKRILRQ